MTLDAVLGTEPRPSCMLGKHYLSTELHSQPLEGEGRKKSFQKCAHRVWPFKLNLFATLFNFPLES